MNSIFLQWCPRIHLPRREKPGEEMERGLTSHFDKKKTHNKTGSNCSEKWDQNGFKFYREIGQK